LIGAAVSLDLYFDECVNARVIAGVRRRGLNLTTAAEQGLLGATDDEHLERATSLGRVIVTADPDFFSLIKARLDAELPFPGLIFLANSLPVGRAVAALELLATVLNPVEMTNRVECA
jgi:hypothetical protein